MTKKSRNFRRGYRAFMRCAAVTKMPNWHFLKRYSVVRNILTSQRRYEVDPLGWVKLIVAFKRKFPNAS